MNDRRAGIILPFFFNSLPQVTRGEGKIWKDMAGGMPESLSNNLSGKALRFACEIKKTKKESRLSSLDVLEKCFCMFVQCWEITIVGNQEIAQGHFVVLVLCHTTFDVLVHITSLYHTLSAMFG